MSSLNKQSYEEDNW